MNSANWVRGAMKNRRGMSLVEVMVVIAIILVLMSVVGVGALTVFADSKVDTTQLKMMEVSKLLTIKSVKKGAPSTSDGLKAAYGSDDIPKDGWGNDFVYMAPGPNGKPFELISYGSDGVEGGTGNAADIKLSEIQ